MHDPPPLLFQRAQLRVANPWRIGAARAAISLLEGAVRWPRPGESLILFSRCNVLRLGAEAPRSYIPGGSTDIVVR